MNDSGQFHGEADAGALLAAATCTLDSDGHCMTCSDEAVPAMVVRVDEVTGLAIVLIGDASTEVDVTLVDAVRPGQLVLVHGGVAISILEEQR